jgi:PhnB protein
MQEVPMAVKGVPEGYHSVTPYLVVKGAAQAIEFYKRAFNAQEMFRMDGPNGSIGHAEIKIGNSIVMMADENPQMGAKAPATLGGSPVSLLVYVDDVDTFAAQAVKAGLKVVRPLENQFYGDRMGSYTDPYGHTWHLASHVEDVSPEEMQRRAQEMAKAAQ